MHGERQLKRRSKGLSSWTDVYESQFDYLYTYRVICTLASMNVHATLERNAFPMARYRACLILHLKCSYEMFIRRHSYWITYLQLYKSFPPTVGVAH